MNPLRLFTSLMGFLAAVLAIARDDRRLGWVAVGFLGASLGMRIVQRIQQRRQARNAEPPPPED